MALKTVVVGTNPVQLPSQIGKYGLDIAVPSGTKNNDGVVVATSNADAVAAQAALTGTPGAGANGNCWTLFPGDEVLSIPGNDLVTAGTTFFAAALTGTQWVKVQAW